MIKAAKNTPLNASSGTVPSMESAIVDWLQKMSFLLVTKSQVNFVTVETTTTVTTRGIIQPFTAQQLQMKAEGERSWRWHKLHTETGLELKTDDIVNYLGKNYRVMSKQDYSLYGYFEYDVLEDYE